MYALFNKEKQIGGLVKDVPVADEEGGQLLPAGYRVRQVAEKPSSA